MTPPLRILCFVPDQDTPGKVDTTHAFLPEARAFARYHGADPDSVVKRFPAHAPLAQRRSTCTLAIRNYPASSIEVLAFFCHGWRSGLQAGYNRKTLLMFASLVAKHCTDTAHVLFYACDTSRDADEEEADDLRPGPGGDGGFADEVRDACEALGRHVTVMGHSAAGHCSWNPYARFFAPGMGGKGGEWYVTPRSHVWPAWVKTLRDPRASLRYRFWLLTSAEIEEELAPRVA